MTTIRRRVALLAASAALVAGCSGNPSAEVTSDGTPSSASTASEPAPATSAPTTPTAAQTESDVAVTTESTAPDGATMTPSAGPDGADVSMPAEPLAVLPGSEPFAEVAITDLRRVGDLLALNFSMTTREDSDTFDDFRVMADVYAAPEDSYLDGEGIGSTSERRNLVSGVTLVDAVNNRRHLVARDSEGGCLCTGFPTITVEPATTYQHAAQFAAPPPDVTTMTVAIPNHPTVEVEIRDDTGGGGQG